MTYLRSIINNWTLEILLSERMIVTLIPLWHGLGVWYMDTVKSQTHCLKARLPVTFKTVTGTVHLAYLHVSVILFIVASCSWQDRLRPHCNTAWMCSVAHQSTTEGLSKMMVQVTFLKTVEKKLINLGSRRKLQNISGLNKLILLLTRVFFFFTNIFPTETECIYCGKIPVLQKNMICSHYCQ
jgi:hypothetical protein